MGQFNLTNSSNYFKEKYAKPSENTYNSANVTLGRYKKSYDFTGKRLYRLIPQSFNGGVGSGSLPIANTAIGEDALLTAKKVYSVVEIEREAIKAADGKDGSFVSQTKHTVQKGVESFMRNMSRILWNEQTNGALGTGDGSTAVTGDGSTTTPYLVIISAATWKEANWEEMDHVNVGTETTALYISAVVPATRQIALVGTSSALATAVAGTTFTSAIIYMQGSKDNDPLSIPAILAATTSTLYSVPVGRRWQGAVQADSSGAGITTDLMNKDMLQIQQKCGKVPNLIITSYAQYRKILNLLEDQKQYNLDPRSTDLKGKISFKGLEFMSSTGAVPIFPERFVKDDYIFYMNDDFMELVHRPGFGWFDDDGTVFLRKASEDAYDARYGGYMENYVAPVFHGYRKGLATT